MYILDPNSFFNRHVSSDKNANILVGLVLSSLYSQLSKGTSEQNWEGKQKDTQDQPTLLQHWRLVLHGLLSVFKLSQLGIHSLSQPRGAHSSPVCTCGACVHTQGSWRVSGGRSVFQTAPWAESEFNRGLSEPAILSPALPSLSLLSILALSHPYLSSLGTFLTHGGCRWTEMGTDLGFSSDPAPSEVPLWKGQLTPITASAELYPRAALQRRPLTVTLKVSRGCSAGATYQINVLSFPFLPTYKIEVCALLQGDSREWWGKNV